jgi:hypothetical protein
MSDTLYDELFGNRGVNPDKPGYDAWRAQIEVLLEEHGLRRAVTIGGARSFNSALDVRSLLEAGCDPGRIAAAKLLAFGD